MRVALNVQLADAVIGHGGFFVLERPANQSSGYFANKSLPNHSTITETSLMRELAQIVAEELVDRLVLALLPLLLRTGGRAPAERVRNLLRREDPAQAA